MAEHAPLTDAELAEIEARAATRYREGLIWAIDNHDCGDDPDDMEQPCEFCSHLHAAIVEGEAWEVWHG